ncbi:hypothetical protein J8J14_14530 [Roseomonas sp. SSH11]|uniref:Flagellar assembly regulator FliX n=1 Tax=Pararoseomonas baculiformis TaxID=2820812 RepID=A0ABS4AHI3_9PROT|nr:hypothetical protein [Pararoseomonas baculiformis]
MAAGRIGMGGITRAAVPAERGAPRARGGFRLPPAGTAPASGPSAAGTVQPLGLMALQEVEDAAGRDQRGAARARALLQELSALQAEMLRGRADSGRLLRLAELAEGEPPADPVLADALAGIALRARVELARRGIMVAAR